MDKPPAQALWRQALRERRRQELSRPESEERRAWSTDEHRVSLTQVHDNVLAVLARIDAAEDAMRGVLRAWAQDPARGGAHLLGSAAEGPPTDPNDPPPTVTWPSAAGDDTDALAAITERPDDPTDRPTIPLHP